MRFFRGMMSYTLPLNRRRTNNFRFSRISVLFTVQRPHYQHSFFSTFFVLHLFCAQRLSVTFFLRCENCFSYLREIFFLPSKLSVTCKWRMRRLQVLHTTLACDDSGTCKWYIFSKAPKRSNELSISQNLRCHKNIFVKVTKAERNRWKGGSTVLAA